MIGIEGKKKEWYNLISEICGVFLLRIRRYDIGKMIENCINGMCLVEKENKYGI